MSIIVIWDLVTEIAYMAAGSADISQKLQHVLLCNNRFKGGPIKSRHPGLDPRSVWWMMQRPFCQQSSCTRRHYFDRLRCTAPTTIKLPPNSFSQA